MLSEQEQKCILTFREIHHQLEQSTLPRRLRPGDSLAIPKIEREEQNASVTRKGRARSFLVLGGMWGRREENFHTFGLPGIPTSHSIKFIEPSAALAGFA